MNAQILLWMARRPYPRPVVAELLSALRDARVTVVQNFGDADPQRIPSGTPYDLHVLKSHLPVALHAAAVAEAVGGTVINPVASVRAVRDKAEATARLTGAGLPVPRTWLMEDARAALRDLPVLPAVIKPVAGDLGRDVQRVTRREQLADLPDRVGGGPVLVQELVPSDGSDLKVYGIADRLYAVRKSHDAGPGDPGDTVALPSEAREIAERCAALFNLELFGVDLLCGPGGFVVIDVNDFPGYKGVPEAGTLLAEHLIGRLAQLPTHG